jgi:hypothetical protein
MYEDMQHPWMAILQTDQNGGPNFVTHLLHNLTWLGLPDFHSLAAQFALDLVQKVLPQCTSLQTLSLRRNQSKHEPIDPHDYVSTLPLMIATFVPRTVTTLELRTSSLCLNELISVLTSHGSSIKHVGIDFGAWVQQYAKQKMPYQELEEEDIKMVARKAARKERFEAYEEAHKEISQTDNKWWLPRSLVDKHVTDQKRKSFDKPKHAFERDFYCINKRPDAPLGLMRENRNDNPDDILAKKDESVKKSHRIEYIEVKTLPELLNSLFSIEIAVPGIKLFALWPEWQEESTDPIDPLALLQQSKGKSLSSTTVQPGVYPWLNHTFHWRPVFDWDAFVKLEYRDGEDFLSTSYNALQEQLSLDPSHSRYDDLLIEITNHFQHLKHAGIPVHLLIGRRHSDASSLYWGWPYDETAWSQWLNTPFDASLRTIAPIVDTLTVMYDLRNPLDEDRLRTIDELSPQDGKVMLNTCPRPVCPWTEISQQCPFQRQWYHSEMKNQKMANKYNLKTPESLPRLAPHTKSLPPTGKYVQASLYTTPLEDSLHDLARIAAFQREAVGWQRFWSTYAPQLTDLSELHIRMPGHLDSVRSVSLAQSLVFSKSWSMVAYADECADVQAMRDVKDGEAKRWPAGLFVRRSWFLQHNVIERGSFGDEEANIEQREKLELNKAINKAADASRLEQEREPVLKEKSGDLVKLQPILDAEDADMERKLVGIYGRKLRLVAQHTWRRQIQDYVDELSDTIGALEPGGDVGSATSARNILRQTQVRLKNRLQRFRLSAIWRRDGNMRNGVGLVAYTRDYGAEETKNRERSNKREIVTELDVTQTPGQMDDWDPYATSLPSGRLTPGDFEAQTVAQTGGENEHDSVSAQVQDLLEVLQTHGRRTYNEEEDASAQVEHLLGELRTHATPVHTESVTRIHQTIEIDSVASSLCIPRKQASRVEESMEFQVTTNVENHAQSAADRQSAPSPINMRIPMRKDTPSPKTTPPKERNRSKEFTSSKRAAPVTEPTPLKQPTPPKQTAPLRVPSPSKEPTQSNKLTRNKAPEQQEESVPLKKKLPSQKQLSPSTNPVTSEQTYPPASSPSPHPTKKSAPRKRKDPVIVDDIPDLNSGRKLRSSRSVTPAKSYKEETDEEDVTRERNKGRRKKRTADTEWEEETIPKKRGRKKKGKGRE